VSARPAILCISLSPILSDARVLRQIGVLARHGDVTTIGFGAAPDGVVEHIPVPESLKTLPQTPRGMLWLALRQWRSAELAAPAVRFALHALAGRRFDLVVANEARVLSLAHAVADGAPVWADMHEWAPEERTHILSWRLLVAPLMTHLCREYLPRSGAVTAVCGSIADLYRECFGVETEVMRNSGPRRDLTPQPLERGRIRLVHSGVAVHGRNLKTMIDVVGVLDERYTLDLYLLPGGDEGRYLSSLKRHAKGCDRIVFRDPVAPTELPATLNAYDVGVFWIPPTHTNARFALPNKFFDFVQARLAIAVGPSIEMASLVTEFDLGIVSDGFSTQECLASIATLSLEAIVAAKGASDAAAEALSFETDAAVADAIITRLLVA
jgi:hypothetical protein